jgi:hypothetical protein
MLFSLRWQRMATKIRARRWLIEAACARPVKKNVFLFQIHPIPSFPSSTKQDLKQIFSDHPISGRKFSSSTINISHPPHKLFDR